MPRQRPFFKVAVPAGIGDIVWTLTKFPALRRRVNKEIYVTIAGRGVRRSETFVNMFTFVDQANYGMVPIMCKGPGRDEEGYTRFAGSRFRYRKWDLFLIANSHLEHGLPLEDWFTELDTDFEIGKEFVFQEPCIENAKKLQAQIGPYAVFYLGPKRGNTNTGHNRGGLWSIRDWCELTRYVINEKNCSVVLTGAPYDADFTRMYLRQLDNESKGRVFNKVGETSIGQTYANILYSKCCVSYQSGIGIFSIYLGVPTVLWWRPTGNSLAAPNKHPYIINEDMGIAQAPPWARTNGMYLREVYTKSTPESLAQKIDERGWFDLEIERNFTPRMTLEDIGKDMRCPMKSVNTG